MVKWLRENGTWAYGRVVARHRNGQVAVRPIGHTSRYLVLVPKGVEVVRVSA